MARSQRPSPKYPADRPKKTIRSERLPISSSHAETEEGEEICFANYLRGLSITAVSVFPMTGEDDFPRPLIRGTWKTTAAAIKGSAVKGGMNKMCAEKKGGGEGSSLKHAGAAASQCRLNDLPRVLYCALACFRDHLESISAHFHLTIYWLLIVWEFGLAVDWWRTP